MLEIIDTLWTVPRDTTHRLRNGEPTPSLHGAAYTRYCLLQRSYLTHELGVQDKAQDSGFVRGVAQLLRNNLSRSEAVSAVERQLKSQVGVEYCEEIVCFTARLLVMTNVGRFMSEAQLRRKILWESSSLRGCMDDYFSEAPKMSCEGIKFPKTFNAWSIDSVGGIKVRLTDNLADHLLLVEDDTTVLIFHHASFLEFQDAK